MKDHYSILGVDKSATHDQIKRAYRKLAMQHHPDRGGDENYFQQIQTAYDTLSDAQKRAEYDQPQGFYTNKHNFDDILDQYFTQFDLRSQMRNSRIGVWITLAEVATGGPKLLTLSQGRQTLPVQIDIPQGVQDGEAVRYPKLLPNNQDLVVEFRIQPDHNWTREGLDLWCKTQLNFWQLIVGTEITINSITGSAYKLQVPACTKPDGVLRLKGKGLQRHRHNAGDIFVRIQATMPEHVPDEIVDILHKIDINK